MNKITAIKRQSWAGIQYTKVEVIGETPKRFRCRVIEKTDRLPGNRVVSQGDVVLIPKHAVVEISSAEYGRSKL